MTTHRLMEVSASLPGNCFVEYCGIVLLWSTGGTVSSKRMVAADFFQGQNSSTVFNELKTIRSRIDCIDSVNI